MAIGADKLMEKLHELRKDRKAIEQECTQLRLKLTIYEYVLFLFCLDHNETSSKRRLAPVKEENQTMETGDSSSVDSHGSRVHTRPSQGSHYRMKEGTIKYDCYRILAERGTFMTTQEIFEGLAKKGRSFTYRNPSDLLGAVLRKSIHRQQGLFVKDGRRFGLMKWLEKAPSDFSLDSKVLSS